MNERVMTLGSVVINVVDLDAQTAFWSAVLGSEVAFEIPSQFVWLKPQHEGGISVALQQVDDPTQGTRRLHLDASVPDIDAAKARIIELGGSLVEDREHDGFQWTTLADPEGNEFCISPAGAH